MMCQLSCPWLANTFHAYKHDGLCMDIKYGTNQTKRQHKSCIHSRTTPRESPSYARSFQNHLIKCHNKPICSAVAAQHDVICTRASHESVFFFAHKRAHTRVPLIYASYSKHALARRQSFAHVRVVLPVAMARRGIAI